MTMAPKKKISKAVNSITSANTSIGSRSAPASRTAATTPKTPKASPWTMLYATTAGTPDCILRNVVPSRCGVRNGSPWIASMTRNHAATTTAPMTPATMPSRRTERSVPVMERPGAILAPVHRTSNPTSGVAGETDAVIGVAEMRWQRGAVCDRAPRVGVTPGAATADAPRARRRSSRILLGRALVIIVGEPVGAPLVAHAREIREPERVGWRGADDGQAADRRGQDRKSTRLNSSHTVISYAVFCLKTLRPPPSSTLFPYTTLFRSHG